MLVDLGARHILALIVELICYGIVRALNCFLSVSDAQLVLCRFDPTVGPLAGHFAVSEAVPPGSMVGKLGALI